MNFFQIDCHNHTKFCNHAKGEMEEYVKAAIKRGIKKFCFLEHVEVGVKLPKRLWMREIDIPEYLKECRKLKEKFKDLINIKCGLEAGFNPLAIDKLTEILKKHDLDVYGISYHHKLLPQENIWINLVSVKNFDGKIFKYFTEKEIVIDYLNTLIRSLDFFSPDFICHLDGISKNITFDISDREIKKSVEILFKKMARKDIKLEINLSGFDYTGKPFPSIEIIKLAKEMGLKFLMGSDSHSPEEVGRNIEKLKEYLMENNFSISS